MLGTESDAIINAAWLYYHEELNQAEIAKYLHIPRYYGRQTPC